ncbi:hypothetical protein WA1_06355 [Scytonema hofmannii PCC 7110]|uniref:Uncharacterized protein n=1 Tax=Scytonema hofmannii PCC 7110 TaxID=128403 RepID=A0A139WSM4_9CYAN|nr:DUF2281 domain-containing protein [Scytonema hofmannii]KYC35445.1 hypothetical protein WA1_06355 [Scytonema hofmannii PCC 7110]
MNSIRERLLTAIDNTPEPILEEVLSYLEYLKTKHNGSPNKPASTSQESEPILRGSKAKHLLKFAGTWQGDDFEECLQLVYNTRSQSEF